MSYHEHDARGEQPTGVFLGVAIAAAVICGLACVPSIVNATRDVGGSLDARLGAAVGAGAAYLAIGTTVIWAILYVAVVRTRAPSRASTHFAIIGATMLAAQVLAISLFGVLGQQGGDDEAQSKIALASIRADMVTVSAATLDHPPVIDPRPKATGAAGILEGAMKTYLNTVWRDRTAFAGELKACGFMTVLAPRNLGADPGLKRSAREIAEARVIVTKYEALNAQRLEEIKRSIASSSMDDDSKAQFAQGVSASSGHREIWALEFRLLDEFTKTIDDLARSRGHWRADGKLLRFADSGDMNTYNQHIAAIKAIGAEEEAMRRSIVQNALATLDGAAPSPN